MNQTVRFCLTTSVAIGWLLAAGTVGAQENSQQAEPAAANVQISGDLVTIQVPAGSESVIIDNLHAPLASIKWSEANADHEQLKITPLVDRWEIKFPRQSVATSIKLQLATTPLRTAQLTPIQPAADGGFKIPAHRGQVVGEKLRYELQPWKNTVGYWVNVDDYVYFLIHCDRPGQWNVGILQGCGKGQGGSAAVLSLHGPIQQLTDYQKDQAPLILDAVSQVDFHVEETGHFQNFIWRHLGVVAVPTPGVYAVKIWPKKIAKGAVMDVRAVSLTRLPD